MESEKGRLQVHYVVFPALMVAAHATKQALQRKMLEEKKETKRTASEKKERSRATVVIKRGGRGLQTAKQTRVTAVLMVLHGPKAKGGWGE